MGLGGQRHVPAALLPGKTRYPLYRRLGGPQGRSGRVWKISPPPGFDPQTAPSVASRYTNRTIPAQGHKLSDIIQRSPKITQRMIQNRRYEYRGHVAVRICKWLYLLLRSKSAVAFESYNR
jgi:hypothetical protein